MPEVTRTLLIEAVPSAVWRWLATPEALQQWLSPSPEIDLEVGGAYRFLGEDGGTLVALTHDGFAGIGSDRWRDVRQAYERGADRHRVLERIADLVTAEHVRAG